MSDEKIFHNIPIENLLKKYTVEEIENSVVNLFIKNYSINTKNKILVNIINTKKLNVLYDVEAFFKDKNIILDLMTLEKIFELLLEDKYRKKAGSFYTPYFIVDFLSSQTICENSKVLDMACGCGAFLIGSVKHLQKITNNSIISIIENHIYGVDISSISIYRAKIILSLYALLNLEDKDEIEFNLYCANSLIVDWKSIFPDIMINGGFDVIIGNPPYTKELYCDVKEVSTKFEVISRNEITVQNISILFIELMVKLSNKSKSCCGLILPLSIAYNNHKQFEMIREYIANENGKWYFSFYDRSPDSLFGDSIKTRNAIVIFKRNLDHKTEISTTKLIRWNSQARNGLFSNIKYQSLNGFNIKKGIPKISSLIELHTINLMCNTGSTLKDSLRIKKNSQNNDCFLYFYSTAYNWLPVLIDIPKSYNENDDLIIPKSLNRLACNDINHKLLLYSILNSKISYWYWMVFGDGFHLTKQFILGIPINPYNLSSETQLKLIKLGGNLWENVQLNYISNTNNKKKIGNYNPIPSDSIIKEIDTVLIEELSFDEYFLDFINKRYYDHISAGRDKFKNVKYLKVRD